MDRKNRGVTTFLRYGLLGLISGTVLGALVGEVFVAVSPARFQADIVLFHIPTYGTSDSARDFIASTLAQPDFLPDFVSNRRIDTKTEALLRRNLTVIAKDASRPVAEIQLIGNDSAAITSTLDVLAAYMVESVHSSQNIALDSQLRELNPIIDAAKRRHDDLIMARSAYGRLPPSALGNIRVATSLTEQRLQIELAQRYRLKPPSAADVLELQRRLNDIIVQQAQLAPSMDEQADVNSDHVELESAVTHARAELRVLEQTKQRLLGEFSSSKPLQIVHQAKTIPLTTEQTLVVLLAAAGSLIGGLSGGLGWSMRQSRNGKINGPVLERRLRTAVVGVMAENLTDYGERELRPLALADPRSLAMAGVRSLNVALHVMSQERRRAGPVVFAEIGDGYHASHVVANLAVVAAQMGEQVLIVEASGSDSRLSSLFANDKGIARTIALDTSEVRDERDVDVHFGNGSIRFAIGDDPDETILPVPVAFIANFDRVFIHTGQADRAKQVVKAYGTGIGIVVCTAEAPLSVLRKALARQLHGVVLCAYPIDESDYLGASATG